MLTEHYYYLCSAPLTEEEVAAIDAAGAQGEPVEFDLERGPAQTALSSRLQLPPWVWHVVRTLISTLALLVVLATFAYFS